MRRDLGGVSMEGWGPTYRSISTSCLAMWPFCMEPKVTSVSGYLSRIASVLRTGFKTMDEMTLGAAETFVFSNV